MCKAEPEPHNCNATGCVLNVPSVLGGGSTINGMLYVRGSSVDYDEWARLTGDRGWAYRNVLRYFKKSEDNLNYPINEDRRKSLRANKRLASAGLESVASKVGL